MREGKNRNRRLAIVLSHPTQYYSPWFRNVAASGRIDLRVFYLWNFGVTTTLDRTFGNSFAWDIPLLDGYEHEFVPNQSRDPGTHHFRGLDCPLLNRRVADWNPDAILLFGYNYWSHLKLLLSRRLAHVPILFRGDSHLLGGAGGFRSRLKTWIRRLAFRRLAGALAVGSANREYLLDSGIPSQRIFLAPHSVDNHRFQVSESAAREQANQWRQQLGIPPRTQVILFAGKLEEKKRPLDLLLAFQRVWNRRKSARHQPENNGVAADSPTNLVILFVGSGPQSEELRLLASQTPDLPVFFAPFQNQSQMPMVYAAGDVFVLPSYGRGETWGLAVNEAMNLRLPLIVSSHVGCGPDLVRPGQNGWIFTAGSADDLENTLWEATADSNRLRSYGEASRAIVNDYSYDRAAEGLFSALDVICPIGVRVRDTCDAEFSTTDTNQMRSCDR